MATSMPLNTPLQHQIDEFIAEGASWLPPDLLRDVLRPIGQLVTSGVAENALKEGARAPDFTLPDARGNAVRLSHLLRRGPVVMGFYRGQWCPYCHLALRAYQQALPQLEAEGATLVAISPQTPSHSKALAVRTGHKRIGANLPAFNGDDSWELPMAGTFLVDRSGIVRLAFVDPDFTRRLDPSIILARLNELKG